VAKKVKSSVAEPHHFYAAPTRGKNCMRHRRLRLLLYYMESQLFEKEQKLIIGLGLLCQPNFVLLKIVINTNGKNKYKKNL
jgi:hypothetical protein